MFESILLALAMAGVAPGAGAMHAPETAPTVLLPGGERWRDLDPMACAPQWVDVTAPEWLARIERGMALRPRDPRPFTEYGYAESIAGNVETMHGGYRDALARVANRAQERHVRWSYGWALNTVGDHDGAIAQWQQAVALHGGRPYWVPYSMAVAHWSAGRHDEALAWYRSAVDSMPMRWGTEAGLARATRWWKPVEREAVDALFLAWRAAEPRKAAIIDGVARRAEAPREEREAFAGGHPDVAPVQFAAGDKAE